MVRSCVSGYSRQERKPMRRYRFTCGVRLASMMMLLLIPVAATGATVVQASGDTCRPDGNLTTVPDLAEGSGVAASRRVPGRLWTHNDSGSPMLLALEAKGNATARVSVSGAAAGDWEAIAVGRCPAGSCLYIGDIGDNEGERARITIFRVPEPDAAARTMAVDAVFHATYPDGAQDAEALLVSPEGRLFIVTKGEQRSVALYRFPSDPRSGASVALERV